MFGRHLPLSEQALQVIEQIGEDMPGGFFIYKATGNEELLYANKAVFKIFGCETLEEFKQLTGYTFKGMLYPDDYEKVSVSIVDQIEKSQGNLDYVEYRIVRKDGKVRWLDDYGHYVNSDVYGGLFYVFISDITEKRVQMEADKAVFTAVIDALSRAYYAVWLINDIATGSFSLFRVDTSEGSIHARPTNEALELLTFEDAKANYINNYVAPSDRERLKKELTLENIVANTTSKKVFGVGFKRIVGSEERYYRIEFAQVQLPNGKTGIVAGFKDVDDDVRKDQEIQQVLRDAIDTANASSKAKSDFLSSMSHDIRTPMNGIIGMTAIATAHLDDRERVEDCLKKISEASSHLLSLINEVLDMNKIESGKVELNEENFNLSELVDTLLAMTKAQLESHHHTLTVNIADVIHENVIGDSHRIQQVFVNLMSNAIKYTPDGGTISLTVAERPTNAHGVACYEFVFEDNGIGMTEDFQKHLFEPFTRANDKKTAAIQGTGLGMTITQSLVRMMGGDIQVKSRPGEGSRIAVTIYLKFVDVQNAEAHKEDPLKNLEDLKFEGKRILLVEDHPVNAEIAKNVLQMTGLEIEWVMDGAAAVERMADSSEGEFDLVFMDIQMPNMDGYQATAAIRAMTTYARRIPIVAMTANAFADDIRKAKEVGMNDHISKPIDFKELAKILQKWIRV
ncbi:ATP-binding protein [Fibrobacter sp.]|uniref:ATP-binding protein n=1 Tax=Fibrobacter sp. TaxID=35828 RepID=UPI00388F96F0